MKTPAKTTEAFDLAEHGLILAIQSIVRHRPLADPSAEDTPRLLELLDNAYPLNERVAVKVGKAPYVRLDLNDYSVPHTKVGRLLTVLADPYVLRIVDGTEVLACHSCASLRSL